MKPKTQAAANMNAFDALPIGAMFTVVAKRTYRLIEVYHKHDAERVQASDGRIWSIAYGTIPNGSEILCPYGNFSHAQNDITSRLFGMTNEEARKAIGWPKQAEADCV